MFALPVSSEALVFLHDELAQRNGGPAATDYYSLQCMSSKNAAGAVLLVALKTKQACRGCRDARETSEHSSSQSSPQANSPDFIGHAYCENQNARALKDTTSGYN